MQGDLGEQVIALVDRNLLIKKSSNGKDSFSLNSEMISNTDKIVRNRIMTNSSSTDANTRKEYPSSYMN